jgi:AcrR family transcriptional regulator
MPKPTFHNLPEEKRQRLIELAIDEFAERPYEQASISRIVARAGIAKGSVYQYFEDKFDLYRWLVIEEVGRRKRARLGAETLDPKGDPFALLERMIVLGLRFFVENPRLARVAASIHEPSTDPEVRRFHEELRRAGRAFMRDLLGKAQEAGHLDPEIDLDLAAHVAVQITGPGLADALLDRLGTDLRGFLAHPSAAKKVDEAQIQSLARGTVALLRHGLARRKHR